VLGDTNHKGAVAEAFVAAQAIRAGYRVLRPLDDGGRYDLVFDDGRDLLRVQCKWAVKAGDVVQIRSYTSRRCADGQKRSPYLAGEIDLLAAYCAELDKVYVIPGDVAAGRFTFHLRLAPARNNQEEAILWAADHELGAIAQLGERLHGMQEVAGSSPASSTSTPLS
jgi:hypothetical protein